MAKKNTGLIIILGLAAAGALTWALSAGATPPPPGGSPEGQITAIIIE